MPVNVEKVVCYLVHDDHLLVFTHDELPLETAGVQVPAGSIDERESPEDAALRELYEETGLRGKIVRTIGTQRYDLRPLRDEIAIRHFYEMRLPAADINERWTSGEEDVLPGERSIPWTCWWLPLKNAHVLAAGFGAMIGSMVAAER